MKRIELAAELRTEIGSKSAKSLRNENSIPCVIYGGNEPAHFSLDEITMKKYIFTPEVFLYEIELNGSKHLAAMGEVQFHPVTDRPIHIDFIQLDEAKEASIAVPIKLIGTPVGVRNGGRLAKNYNKITVKGLPSKLPEFLEINVEGVKIGQSLRIGEIETDGLEIIEDPKNVLMAVKMARTVVEEELDEEEDEEGATPEEGGAEASSDAPTEEKSESSEG